MKKETVIMIILPSDVAQKDLDILERLFETHDLIDKSITSSEIVYVFQKTNNRTNNNIKRAK